MGAIARFRRGLIIERYVLIRCPRQLPLEPRQGPCHYLAGVSVL
jgi:hypothetical protein